MLLVLSKCHLYDLQVQLLDLQGSINERMADELLKKKKLVSCKIKNKECILKTYMQHPKILAPPNKNACVVLI